MESILRKIFGVLGGGNRVRPERAYVAAFGKHPGWDDHIDDIGLETEYLADLKRCLYIEGIGGNIDSGIWQRLETEHHAQAFDHQFVWLRGEDTLVGRLWASRDGKGRTRYPMVVVAHCPRLPIERAMSEVLPRLEHVRESSLAAKDATTVRGILASAQRDLRERLTQLAGNEATAAPDWKTQLVACAMQQNEHCAGPRGMLSVLYQIEREMSEYCRENAMGIRPRDPTVLVSSPAQPPQPLRVPPCGASTLESMRLWSALLLSLLQHSTPIFMLRPVEGQWMDVIVGDPTASQLYCLRASPEAVPFTTEIPYTLDPKFVERAGRFIGLDDVTIASLSATTNGAVAASAPSPASA